MIITFVLKTPQLTKLLGFIESEDNIMRKVSSGGDHRQNKFVVVTDISIHTDEIIPGRPQSREYGVYLVTVQIAEDMSQSPRNDIVKVPIDKIVNLIQVLGIFSN